MDNSSKKDRLIDEDNLQSEPYEFPNYQHVLSESQGTEEASSPSKLKRGKSFEYQAEEMPEIFSLGGNKKLNERMFLHREQKLKRLEGTKIIECQQLGKQYILEGEDPVHALKDITLSGEDEYGAIKKGEFVIIRGPSGGGKTTFLNLLGTIDSATKGQLKIQNERITAESSDSYLSKLRREKIGIVFQTFNLLALMTAYENVELPMQIKGKLKQKQMKERTRMLLKKVGLLERADHLPSELSGGEQQRVAISRSLANSPAIILLDEPTGDLDSKSTIEVMNILVEINNFGYDLNDQPTTIVMVTHNQDLQCYGDRLIFFEDGKIKKQILNQFQFALDPEEYSQFLNTKI